VRDDEGNWRPFDASKLSRQEVLNQFATCPPSRELSGALYRETFWLVADHLGTPRMVVDKSGSLAGVKRHDYLPFGEELFTGQGGRSTAQGYNSIDNVRQKFTGYERDGETGLHYAHARYYANAQGRFISPDSFGGSANNPQSLNLYSYVRDNPLRYVDPTGRIAEYADDYTKNVLRAVESEIKWVNAHNFKLPLYHRQQGQQGGQAQLPGATVSDGESQVTVSDGRVTEWHPIPPSRSFWSRLKSFFGFGGAATAATVQNSWGNPSTLQEHFDGHGTKVNARTPQEYVQKAQDLLVRSQQPGAREDGILSKYDPNDQVIRVYDEQTEEFGAYNANGTTRTYLRPTRSLEYFEGQPGRPLRYLNEPAEEDLMEIPEDEFPFFDIP
jgi:RHS repeat-associated protein